MGLLDDRVCVITGGAGSFGLASARLFLAEGATVMLVDLDGAALARTVADLASPNVDAVAADVSQATGARGYIERTVARSRVGPVELRYRDHADGGRGHAGLTGETSLDHDVSPVTSSRHICRGL